MKQSNNQAETIVEAVLELLNKKICTISTCLEVSLFGGSNDLICESLILLKLICIWHLYLFCIFINVF